MKRPAWFAKRANGRGWKPVTWQGWLITAAYVVGTIGGIQWLKGDDNALSIPFALPLAFALTGLYVVICRALSSPGVEKTKIGA